MTADALITYLNDHLAGSAVGLELAGRLIDLARTAEEREFFGGLRDEIAADRDTLRELLHKVGGRESDVRQIGGWLTERLSRLKLAFDDEGAGQLRQFETLELLMLGIHGKYALWQALHAARPRIAGLDRVDFMQLAQRASAQRDRVEARRLETARVAFADAA